MQYSCYIEVNVICLIILAIFLSRLFHRRRMFSSSDKLMVRVLIFTCVLCFADVAAMVCRGRFFPGARAMIEGSNILYLAVMPIISMIWCDYTCERLGRRINSRYNLLHRLPLIVFMLVVLLNPVHHFFFSINADNLYVRGPGVFVHWIVSWYYFVVSGILVWRSVRSTNNWIQRRDYMPLLTFLILPAIGCIAQMLFYGVTSVQAGITLSLVLVSQQMQDIQISADELTRLNNRTAMKRYVDALVHNDQPPRLTVMMIDVNHFKQINDTLGHAMGDKALCAIADSLKEACGTARIPLFLCRYGGDEFVVLGSGLNDQDRLDVMASIRSAVSARSQRPDEPFTLSVSIGSAEATCRNAGDFDALLQQADDKMYEDKKKGRGM